MTLPEQAVLNALRGHNSENAKQPSPRLVKIYVSSTKNGKFENVCLYFMNKSNNVLLPVTTQNLRKNVKFYWR